jgi:probable phosphoglycerate mutase
VIETELLLLRHGQAQCNLDGVVGGPLTCTGLTPLGTTQVKRAADRLREEHATHPFDVLIAGTRLRLRQTGAILAEALGLPLNSTELLDGPAHGEADGQPWRTIKDQHGGGPHTHPDTPWAVGSDTWNGYLRRAGDNLQQLIDQHRGNHILLAVHGESVHALHTLLLRIPSAVDAGFTVDNASLTCWQHQLNRLDQHRWLLQRHNDTAHLTDPTPEPSR